jgi:TPR repeat protein
LAVSAATALVSVNISYTHFLLIDTFSIAVIEQDSGKVYYSKSAFIKAHNKGNGKLYYYEGIYTGRTIDQAHEIAQATTTPGASSAATGKTGVLEPHDISASINVEDEVQLQNLIFDHVAFQEQLQECTAAFAPSAEILAGDMVTATETMSGSGGAEGTKDSSGLSADLQPCSGVSEKGVSGSGAKFREHPGAGSGSTDNTKAHKGKGKANTGPVFKCINATCSSDGRNKCSACKRAWYCGRWCQKADWHRHKPECRLWEAELCEALASTRIHDGEGAGSGVGSGAAKSARTGKSASRDDNVAIPFGEGLAAAHTVVRGDGLAGSDHGSTPPSATDAGGDASSSTELEDECPVCFDLLIDPISPCRVPDHKLCRACVTGMREKGVSNACPQCRGEMTDAEEAYLKCVQLYMQAGRTGGGGRSGLYHDIFKNLQQVLAIDPKHRNAQALLGLMYDTGNGVAQDLAAAVVWFQKAAEQGQVAAQYNLGLMYKAGNGVEQDLAVAAVWWRKAAEQEHARAQFYLGAMYDEGDGVVQDAAAAVAWYRKAAEQGYADAQYNLGLKYHKGNGVAQDAAAAEVWWQKAAEQEHAHAQFNLGAMYGKGDGVAQDTAAAVAWFRKAAEQGLADAQFNLGLMYGQGNGMAENLTAGFEWVRKAAEQGHADAQYFFDTTKMAHVKAILRK